ncbi:MAG: ATP-binding protein [Chloroflexi bacterium]|nr:ATP-binding protein [Chloroflexota bacterium]
MSEPIDDVLKKIDGNTSKANSPSSSKAEGQPYMAGDPDCPHCAGLGYLRNDAPMGHPDFGKLVICTCRENEISQAARQRLYAISQLEELNHLTFENFEKRGHMGIPDKQAESIEGACNTAQQYAEGLNGWLLLRGNYGTGKTHLAAAVANQAVLNGIATIFITVPDLLDSLRFTYQNPDETFEERFEEIRQAPLLILDDFGTQNATEWAQEKLFQIINFRYINKLPLVITTNLATKDLEGRIRSRLEDPELVIRYTIDAPDYRRPGVDDYSQQELSSLMHHRNRTFGTFDIRKGEGLPSEISKNLERVFKATQQYAEAPRGWLVLTGDYGSGKTHLAAAIANYQAGLGEHPLFIVVPDLLDHLRATFNPNSPVSYDRRFDEVRTSPLLILDDLGTQSTTPWAREKLYQLFNHRYNAELPTVITTSDSIEEVDARIRSRMLDTRLCTIYAITAPAYTGKKR